MEVEMVEINRSGRGWVNLSYLSMWCCKAIHNYELCQQSHLLPYNTCLGVTDCIYIIS
jgi:hypothetical protein